MMMVDVDRGKADAAALALELEGKKANDEAIPRYEAIPAINLVDEDD
jgi:hypothetical protein